MVLCNIECVQKISQYFEISPRKLHITENNIVAADNLLKDTTIEGFSSIIQALMEDLKQNESIMGNDKITKALIRQWFEYTILCVNYADASANAKRVLKIGPILSHSFHSSIAVSLPGYSPNQKYVFQNLEDGRPVSPSFLNDNLLLASEFPTLFINYDKQKLYEMVIRKRNGNNEMSVNILERRNE